MDRMDRIEQMMSDERRMMNEEQRVFHSSLIPHPLSLLSSCLSCPSMLIIAPITKRAALSLLLCILFMSPGVRAQSGAAARFFPAHDLMRVGVYYYPEHWPESQWERDFANMERLGFEFVHMAEFAWAQMEPEEGKFDFAWLDRAVALAARHHLRVMLCTPTPIPPAWMFEKYPQSYLVGADRRRREHGSRDNNALADPDSLRLSDRIINEMAKR